MDKIGIRQDKLTKNLLIAHMEILLISIRREKDYSFTIFKEFGLVDEFMELLLQFPDDSTLKIEVLISFRFIWSVHWNAPPTSWLHERKLATSDYLHRYQEYPKAGWSSRAENWQIHSYSQTGRGPENQP